MKLVQLRVNGEVLENLEHDCLDGIEYGLQAANLILQESGIDIRFEVEWEDEEDVED